MAQLDDDSATDWHTDLLENASAAKLLDQDLREAFALFLRPRVERQRLEVREGVRLPPLREPTVAEVSIDRRIVLRGSDVRVTWQGLTPRSARVTIIGPDRTEQVVQSGNSIAVRAANSGPITLRLSNQQDGRASVSDVLVGEVSVFELPSFRIEANILPAVPYVHLPPVRIPKHSIAALSVPVPRLSAPSAAVLIQQVRATAPRVAGAAASVARTLGVAASGSSVARLLTEARRALRETEALGQSNTTSSH